MQGVHELADLAPRDVVAKAIMRRMIETGHPHMWLDARHLGAEVWERRFPTILATTARTGRRPGDRADPGRAGVPLRQRRRAHRPVGAQRRAGPLRHRRGRLLRRPRRQPARVQLAARGAGLLAPDRDGAAGRAAALVGAGGRRAHRGPGRRARAHRAPGGDDVAGRRAPQRRGLADAARLLDKLAGRGRRRGRPRLVGDHQPAHHQRRAGRRRRAARGDPRLALARGLPGPRRRALGRPLRRRGPRRRDDHRVPPEPGDRPARRRSG